MQSYAQALYIHILDSSVCNDCDTDDIDWLTDIHVHVRAVTPDYTMSAYVYVSSASEGLDVVTLDEEEVL